MEIICIPGIPIKRENACISPLQEPISHVIKCWKTTEKDTVKFSGYEPNTIDYPEYSYVIQLFIDNVLNKEIYKRS